MIDDAVRFRGTKEGISRITTNITWHTLETKIYVLLWAKELK